MNIVKSIYLWMICSFTLMASFNAHASVVNYTLDNVILDDTTQMTGTFSWTFDSGDFENGVGQFSSLVIPWTLHNQDDLNVSFDIGQSLEITLPGSVHDDGVDITLFLLQPLTPTSFSPIDLVRSKYDIGGNGFHAGLFVSGSIIPSTFLVGDFDVDGDVDGSDFLKWQKNETPNASVDYAVWEANFGGVAQLLVSSVTVPEPSAGLLGVMVCLIGLSFRNARPR